MELSKILWAIRGEVYKLKFGKFGFMSYIGKPTFISKYKKNIYIGKKVRIYPHIRIEIADRYGKLIIGDNTSVGHNVQLSAYQESLIIGKNVTIAGNVLISNNDHTYNEMDASILDQPLIYKKTEIGDNSFVGYNSVILAGVRLGKNCIVGANSVVRAGDYKDGSVIVGAPARVVKRYSKKDNKWEKVK